MTSLQTLPKDFVTFDPQDHTADGGRFTQSQASNSYPPPAPPRAGLQGGLVHTAPPSQAPLAVKGGNQYTTLPKGHEPLPPA